MSFGANVAGGKWRSAKNTNSVASARVRFLRPDYFFDLVSLRRLQLLHKVLDPDPDVGLDLVRIKYEIAEFRFWHRHPAMQRFTFKDAFLPRQCDAEMIHLAALLGLAILPDDVINIYVIN